MTFFYEIPYGNIKNCPASNTISMKKFLMGSRFVYTLKTGNFFNDTTVYDIDEFFKGSFVRWFLFDNEFNVAHYYGITDTTRLLGARENQYSISGTPLDPVDRSYIIMEGSWGLVLEPNIEWRGGGIRSLDKSCIIK